MSELGDFEKGWIAECWFCGEQFTKENQCPECELFVCPHCGKCGCHLSEEARAAVKITLKTVMQNRVPGFYRNKPDKFDEWLRFIVEKHPSLNTCQICRHVNLKDINDIEHCRGHEPRKIMEFGKDFYFNTKKGGPYPNCHLCSYEYSFVYRRLIRLAKNEEIYSRKEYRQDPQKPLGQRDNMRVYYPNEMVTTLHDYSIEKQTKRTEIE